VDQDEISLLQRLGLQQKQADFPLDALGGTTSVKSINMDDLHGNRKTHGWFRMKR
jgi:hypothetical protein